MNNNDNKYTIQISELGNVVFNPPAEKELTEQEVRKLAKKLPIKEIEKLKLWKLADKSMKKLGEKLGGIDTENTTPDHVCSHAHDGDHMQEKRRNYKVSDCCGAGIRVADKFAGWMDCKSCGEPCKAVEGKEKYPSHEMHDTAHDIINYFLQRGARVSKEDYDWLIEKINRES